VPRTFSRPATAAVALATMLLSACATVPDSGAVLPGKDAAAGQQYLLQPLAVGPARDWTPDEVVRGFLEALTSYAHGYATAREYLSNQKNPGSGRTVRDAWDPNPGWGVTVTTPLMIRQIPLVPQVHGGVSSATDATVSVSAQQLATVSDEGQYQVTPSHQTWTWTATLHKFGGQWLITSPPRGAPPLYVSNFHRVYLPRNLYFLAPSNLDSINDALVPDPIFVPLQATSVEVAETLVNSLLHNPEDWLSGAVATAMEGAKLLGRVTINAGTATVNLGGSAASATPAVRGQILAQLVSTLASPSFGQPAVAQSVELEINGHAQQLASWSGGQPQQNGKPLLTVPVPDAGEPLYALAAHNVIQRLTGLANPALSGTRIQVQAAGSLTSIAVSPGGQYVAGISQPSGALYYGPLRPGSKLIRWSRHRTFTSLSWDSNGNLWALGTNYMVMIHPGRPAIPVTGLPSGSLVQMQVAPDGVRVALVVNGPHGNQFEVCALDYASRGPNTGVTGVSLGAPVLIGTDVTNPTQVSWYDPNNLIVLSQPAAGPQLHEVPVNGDSSTALIPDPGMQSIASAGPDNPLAAGLAHGALALTSALNSTPRIHNDIGQSPTYPAPTYPAPATN
jgi:hypothetical protein